MKVEERYASEKFVPINKSMCCHNPELHNLNLHWHVNLRSVVLNLGFAYSQEYAKTSYISQNEKQESFEP
jgi:hypothetical protein